MLSVMRLFVHMANNMLDRLVVVNILIQLKGIPLVPSMFFLKKLAKEMGQYILCAGDINRTAQDNNSQSADV